ncbi:MAG: RyR domain-containing protein [Clostridium sp.]|nr:RyR domain-containing protein [Clostridium sp.]MCM1474641.1 RyR domain-containing protein [Muribaculaceae bacterium]
MKQYTPNPEDTRDIDLPEELSTLLEELAKNVHEVWAQNRLCDGWRYGPVRDDNLKTHPCLVAYEQLPEKEKEYDRATALQTLKFIIKQGYVISPPN